ncbi:MAG: AI-2E family transporter [Bacteroidota bacterium]|nr:AI-2E family transporter [Bacteroidota bacterium]MDP4191356.1 AI-2E family transporter [Bacteroidota bacterium]MDP4196024.1 AI-2E family transporter [Bacteroidota bacterium]
MDQNKSQFSASTAFFIDLIGIVVIFTLLKELSEIFIPLIIAYFLFFLFTPLNDFLSKKKIPETLLIVIDLLLIILVFGGISSVIIDSFTRLSAELPNYERKLNYIVSNTAREWHIKDPAFLNFKIAEVLKGVDYGLLAGNIFTSTFSFFGTLLFVLFFFIFVFTGHKNIYEAIRKWYLKSHIHPDAQQIHKEEKTTESKAEGENIHIEETIHKKHFFIGQTKKEKEIMLQDTFQEITDQIKNYVVAKFFISLAVGIATGIVLLIFKVDFVIVWSVLTFLFNFIPNIGSLIAVILPTVIAMIQFGSIGLALLIAAILVIMHNIFGNIIEPRVFGHRLGLNPLVILLSLLLWGYIWGIIGAILSVPLTAILKIIISRSDSPNLQFISDLMS